ncbi:hypothetical protein XENTR_v10022958 [Xenopus tropicalis]|nr:hypothetical protein XENTR_v10022958 [Xenopus tropicalis]
MLARIRAEAERRGDDWLRQFLPSLEDPQPTTPTRRPRRARPPTRLSPSPPVRRRRPTSPSPQPSTSRSSGRSRGTGGKGPTPSTPPTRQKDPDTPTGRPRGGGMATRQRGGGPDARDDDVTGATSGASGTPTRLRRQASTGSREGGSAIRAGQAEAPGPRGARGAGARERRRVGGPVGGEAGAREAAQGGGGETAVAQATGGTAQPQTRSGPAIQQSWAPVATQERGGGMEAAQAAWHAAGADVARSQMGACGPATRLAGAQEMPSMAQAAWVPTRPGPGPTGNPMGAGGLLTATRESGAMAGSPCYRPLQTPGQQAGPTGNGQESQQGWAPAPTGEANRAVPMGAAAGREGATAAHSVAAQGMPPPLCLQQVQGPGNGEGGTPQQQQGITPGAPGRDSTTTNYNNSAGTHVGLQGQGQLTVTSTSSAAAGGGQTGGQTLTDFIDSLRQLLGQWDGKSQTPGGAPSAAAPSTAQVTTAQGSIGGPNSEGNGEKRGDKPVPLSDSAKGHAYICFEGPLGSHLKPEVREKIWKREYVDIFTLLPLERFNIDKFEKGKEHRKEEDEDRRRYRLIPRTFGNWLQAFAILASVVGEKHPEHCSALFCYLDGIWEAHRVYGGLAWLRYDEQFRQRMAVRQDVRWDHRDIGLWMRLMNNKGYQGYGGPGTTGQQPFPNSSSGQTSSPAGAHKKGACWAFNDSQCKWGASCRFKHECSLCAGAHPLSRCFKKGKGTGGKFRDGFGKGPDAGEARSDAPMAK